MMFRIPKLVIPLLPCLAAGQVAIREAPGKVEISLDGRAFSNLYAGSEWAKPFLHPLRAASGTVVTRGYPLERIAGENQDHVWHHGLWWAHGDVNGVDYWRDKGLETTGRIVLRGKPRLSGASLAFEADFVPPDRKSPGSVSQTFRFATAGGHRLIDARIVVRADRGIAVRLGDTEEGTFAVRLADEFREDRGVAMANAASDTGRKMWGKRAKWVDYSATIRGEKLGVIVFDHPANPKHPTYWHARHYSLLNPFGERDFTKDKSRDGGITIPAGGTIEFRYRVAIHPGALDAIDPEKLFTEFAKTTP